MRTDPTRPESDGERWLREQQERGREQNRRFFIVLGVWSGAVLLPACLLFLFGLKSSFVDAWGEWYWVFVFGTGFVMVPAIARMIWPDGFGE